MYPLFLEGKAISELFINDQIRAKEVRVIGIDGEQLGVMSIQDARKVAEDEGVDGDGHQRLYEHPDHAEI